MKFKFVFVALALFAVAISSFTTQSKKSTTTALFKLVASGTPGTIGDWQLDLDQVSDCNSPTAVPCTIKVEVDSSDPTKPDATQFGLLKTASNTFQTYGVHDYGEVYNFSE